MTISLIASTLGRRDVLKRFLASLERQSFADFEIIVVDQNPEGYLDDILAAHAANLRLTHIRSSKGLSLGRNVGLRAATGDILAFPDDDCWYRPELLAEVRALFDLHPQHGMLLGRTVDPDGRNSIVPSLPHDAEVDRSNVIAAANSNTIFLRREIAPIIGPFDEKLGTGSTSMFEGAEDRDYIARAMAAGIKVRFVHGLTVFHEQIDASQTSHLARIRKYSLGDGAFYRKHHYGPGRIAILAIRAIGGIPLRILRGEAPQLAFKLTYCYYLLSGYLHWTGEI